MPFDAFWIVSRFAALAVLAAVVASSALPAHAQSENLQKRIGIIGGGNIGGTFGELWTKAGYEVLIASRHPEELKPLVEKLGPKARAGTPAEALSFADAVFMAVPYKAYPEFGREHATALKGKVVIDAGNAVPARDGALREEVDANGIGATSQKYLPGARIARAFNAANFKVFLKNAGRPEPRMAIPIAGDDPRAIEAARSLVADAGFDPVVVGELDAAKKFQMGQPGFGLELSAPELKERLGARP